MKKIYLHPLTLRIWHWANALVVILLIITGIQIRIPGVASLRPQDLSLLIHKYAGWAMAASWFFYLGYGLIRDHLKRHYVFKKRDLKGTFRQAKYYLLTIFSRQRTQDHCPAFEAEAFWKVVFWFGTRFHRCFPKAGFRPAFPDFGGKRRTSRKAGRLRSD